MRDFVAELDAVRDTGRMAMATLVAAQGGSPRPLGTRMFVDEEGRSRGSVSIGGCVDARLADHARRILKAGRAERIVIRVDDDEARDLGLSCGAEFQLIVDPVSVGAPDPVLDVYRGASDVVRAGGSAFVVRPMDGGMPRLLTNGAELRAHGVDPDGGGAQVSADGQWFVERLAPPDTLLIVGATEVALALTRLASLLGMQVVVVDGRDRDLTRERFPQPVRVGMPSDLVRPYLRPGTYLVLACHDYRYELPILREALRAPLPFVGMLSSRRRASAVRALLQEDGLTPAELARLRSPVGLDIGGRQPEDIALSIAAQLVAVREGKPLGRPADAETLATV